MKTSKNPKLGIEQKAIDELNRRGVTLERFNHPTNLKICGEDFLVPAHDERSWFEKYVRDCIKRGMNPKRIGDITRESYALLRYKQALTGSSNGSELGAILTLSSHGVGYHAKIIYQKALEEYDSKIKRPFQKTAQLETNVQGGSG